MHAGNEDLKIKFKSDDKSRVSSYDNVDNVSYGCVLDEDGDTTGEGIYDTIPEEDENNYIEIIP
jgi:hypothetical protein